MLPSPVIIIILRMSTSTLPHDIDLKPVSEMCAVIRGRHTYRFTVRSPLPAAPRNTWFTLKTHSRELSGAIHLWNCRENKQKEIILIGRVITNTMSRVCPSTDTIKKLRDGALHLLAGAVQTLSCQVETRQFNLGKGFIHHWRRKWLAFVEMWLWWDIDGSSSTDN